MGIGKRGLCRTLIYCMDIGRLVEWIKLSPKHLDFPLRHLDKYLPVVALCGSQMNGHRLYLLMRTLIMV